MKTLILALGLMFAFSASAQTNTNLIIGSTAHDNVMVIPLPVSNNAQPGDTFKMDSTRTLVPIANRVESWLTTALGVLAALSVAINGLLGWWNSQGKAIQGLLVRHIEALPDKSIQDRIEVDAISKGLEPALSKVVEANTISKGPVATPITTADVDITVPAPTIPKP